MVIVWDTWRMVIRSIRTYQFIYSYRWFKEFYLTDNFTCFLTCENLSKQLHHLRLYRMLFFFEMDWKQSFHNSINLGLHWESQAEKSSLWGWLSNLSVFIDGWMTNCIFKFVMKSLDREILHFSYKLQERELDGNSNEFQVCLEEKFCCIKMK